MSNASDFVINKGVLEFYTGSDIHVIVPDKVKTISDYTFRRRDNVRSVQLPDSVTKIGDFAFADCTSLEQINIPVNVKTIGAEAFRNCVHLQNVVFSGEPEKIGALAFYGCWKLAGNMQNLIPAVQDFFIRMQNGKMTMDEGKLLYSFSKTKGAATVKDFQNVSLIDTTDPKYIYKFSNSENYLVIPAFIGELPVVKVPIKTLPEDAIVYCSTDLFEKLPRPNKSILAVQWLADDKMLRDELSDTIRVFIKKYGDDVAYALKTCTEPFVYQRFVDIAKPKANLMEKLVEQCIGNPDIMAVLLQSGNGTKQNADDLSLDAKPKMTVTELKKLWTYQTCINSETGETVDELTNYKGHEKHVVIPERIGKTRISCIRCVFPAEVEAVEFPYEDIEVKCSFRNCTKMADADGFVVVNVGSRRILTDYVGPENSKTLTLPAGVTENTYATFKGLDVQEVSIPEGFLKLASSSFMNCAKLEKVSLPDSLLSIGSMAFQNCDALQQLRIPQSVSEIGPLYINRYPPESLTIYGTADSKAQEIAETYKYTFVAE